MILDETIEKYKQRAMSQIQDAEKYKDLKSTSYYNRKCISEALECERIVEWLEELQDLRVRVKKLCSEKAETEAKAIREDRDIEQDAYMRGYNQGYDKGDSDGRFYERADLQKAFEYLHGSEYSWQEICDKADAMTKEQNNESQN